MLDIGIIFVLAGLVYIVIQYNREANVDKDNKKLKSILLSAKPVLIVGGICILIFLGLFLIYYLLAIFIAFGATR